MTKENSLDGMSYVRRKAYLRKMYFHMSRAEELDALFQEAVDDYDSGVLSEEPFEASCLTVIGQSNSGKTREIRHALERLQAGDRLLECGRAIQAVSIVFDGETTWKSLGIKILEQVDYGMSPKKTEHEIWTRVRQQLRDKGMWIVAIDECQHMFETLGEKDTRKVINSIKTLIKNPDWPVVVVLSGIPELLEKVNLDPQLRNLATAYNMRSLDPNCDEDLHEIDTAFYNYAAVRDVNIDDVRNEETYRRLCYATGHHFGRAFKFMVSLFASIEDDDKTLRLAALSEHYADKTQCIPGHNPFIREDYHHCDVGVLLAGL
ncbi:ATP-binding protein [Celeribacter halophilus]|uniref:ATP-binding protein n=1 Tax=Celeribacter halophilus TaxID=576117 RepID=A0AAW7Y0J3_9RHOB|nr:ATP-binding protein [Celeribacter halophilus]MDO6458677.1 ATP-binding protein [Celeribacter halophilus]MDO6722435.1 ATP-binding protein [Celeribacter halophilus]